ncbi:30S ribosomal protein S10 [Halobacteriales archaeon Cl-PHB]
MPFVTTLRLASGDRNRLEAVVNEVKKDASRKGAELKGPHPKPPEEHRVPMQRCLSPGESYDTWSYSVYVRVLEIVGHDDFARSVAQRDLPDSIHVTAEIEQVRQLGE